MRPIVRTYSIRAVRPEQAEVDIEFAIHDHQGPAVDFARQAKAGDKIGISNPGGPKPMLPQADFYSLAGDPPRCLRWPRCWKTCRRIARGALLSALTAPPT